MWGRDGPTLLDAWAGVFSERLGCWLSGVEAGRSSHPPQEAEGTACGPGGQEGSKKGVKDSELWSQVCPCGFGKVLPSHWALVLPSRAFI